MRFIESTDLKDMSALEFCFVRKSSDKNLYVKFPIF